MKVILIRHGMTEGNYKRRYIGVTDEDLADTECLEKDYPNCGIVVSSPKKRCLQSAQYIYPDKEIRVCEKLRECDFGDFENKSFEDLKGNEKYQKWINSGGNMPFPNGESLETFAKRCIEGFFEMLEGESIAYVVHGGTIMAIMHRLFGGDFYDYQVKNGCGYEFEIDMGGKVNDYSAIGCS